MVLVAWAHSRSCMHLVVDSLATISRGRPLVSQEHHIMDLARIYMFVANVNGGSQETVQQAKVICETIVREIEERVSQKPISEFLLRDPISAKARACNPAAVLENGR